MMHSITILCNVDSSYGETTFIENETKHLINKTKTFYFDSETEVELICTPTSNDYELVEVVNSSNFSMNDSSVHHHIKVDGELEVHPIFRKKPKNQVNEVGHLRLNMNDGGVVRLSGEHQDFVQGNQGTLTYPIYKKSLIDIDIKPNEGYDISYIKSNYEKYQTGGKVLFDESEVWIDLRFEPNITEETDPNILVLPDDESEMQSNLISNIQKDNLVVENIIKKQPIGNFKSTPPPSLPKSITSTFIFNFHPHRIESITSQYSCNDNPLHDIVLYRGETYRFKTLHDRSSFELLETTFELFSDDSVKDPIFTLNSDLIFTPTNNTPNKLLLRTKHKKDRIITLSIMNNHFFGNVSAASFIENASVDSSSETNLTNKFGEVIIDNKPRLDALSVSSGVDQITNIENRLKYKTPRGATQVNALTTLFATVYDTEKCDVNEINHAFSKSLAYDSTQNVLVENVVQNIINGDSSYLNLHKTIILVDALLNIGNKLTDFEQFKIKLATRFLKDRLVLFNGDEFLNEILGDLINLTSDSIDIIRNLFSFVLNVDIESGYYNWYKLFAFHYVFHKKYLPVITDEAQLKSQWNLFSDYLQMSYGELNKINIPTELVLSECKVCRVGTENFNTLHDTMKISLSEDSFDLMVMNKLKYSENSYKHLIGKVVQISYLTETSCYEITPYSVNYYDTLRSADTFTLKYNYQDMDECAESLPMTDDEDGDDVINDEEEPLFEFSMVESGSSNIMLNHFVTTDDILIESLGRGEYRLYIDEKIKESDTTQTSPGYIKIPKQFAINMQQHYVRVGYQSGIEKKSIVNAIENEKRVRIVTTYWSKKLQKLVCIAQYSVNIEEGDSLEFINASVSGLNGVFKISQIITDTAFAIELDVTSDFDDYDDISADVLVKSGVRVYCDTNDFKINDSVLFSNHENFPTLIKNVSSDEFGDYVVVFEHFKNIPKYIIKSHAIDDKDEVIDFMFTQKQVYYETTNCNYLEDRLWLTYDPDSDPNGRINQKVSYIQIFYNKDF